MSRGNFPVEKIGSFSHKPIMPQPAEILVERIEKKLSEIGTTAFAASVAAVGHKDMIRDIKRRGTMPSLPKLRKLAEHLGTSVDWLTGESDIDTNSSLHHNESSERMAYRPDRPPINIHDLPRDVPILGSALGHDMKTTNIVGGSDTEISVEMHMLEMGEPIDYLRRLPTITGRRDVYGVTVVGESMVPRFRPGEPVYVDPRRAPQIGDDVIIQLVQPDGDDGQEVISALIKTLARRSSGFIELEQYNPACRFQLKTDLIYQVHRIIPWAELIGI